MTIRTWLNAVEYIEKHEPQASQILAALRQYVTEPFGFSIPGKRATNKDKAAFREWAAAHPIPLMTRDDWIAKLDGVFKEKKLTLAQQRSPRCFALKFIDCLGKLGHLLVVESPQKEPTEEKKAKPRKRRRPDWAIPPSPAEQNRPKQKHQYVITLSFVPEAYLACYRAKYPSLTDEECLGLIRRELTRIKNELDAFGVYLMTRPKRRHRAPTKDNTIDKILMLLGWLFRQTGDLSSVGLSFLIPVVNTKLSVNSFDNFNDYLLERTKLDFNAEQASEQIVEFLLNFFETYGPHYMKETKRAFIDASLNASQFLYCPITKRTRYSDFQDIAVISALRALNANLPEDPPKDKTLPITLDMLRGCLEKFKADLDYPFNECRVRNKVVKKKRQLFDIAHDMQRLLIAGLLLLLPPLRRRTLAELTLDGTLVRGIKTQNGFIPAEKMEDPTKARYHYDMLPEAYKTGDKYGKFFLTLPNYRFRDGSSFYDYLDKYLFGGYRDALLVNGQTHKTLFVRIKKGTKPGKMQGDPISHSSFSDVFDQLCKMMVGKSIRPQICRAIYRTYYVNQGASPQVLESLAYAMQHSPETALKVYTRQTLEEKLAPLIDFHDHLFNNL